MTEALEKWVNRETAVDKVPDMVRDWTMVHPLSRVAAHFWLCGFVQEVEKRVEVRSVNGYYDKNTYLTGVWEELVREFGLGVQSEAKRGGD